MRYQYKTKETTMNDQRSNMIKINQITKEEQHNSSNSGNRQPIEKHLQNGNENVGERLEPFLSATKRFEEGVGCDDVGRVGED